MANEPHVKPGPQSMPASVPPPPPRAAKASPVAKTLGSLFTGTAKPDEIVVYHHSNLFYWWPVWLAGFIMAIITYFSDKHMAIVPAGTLTAKATNGEYQVGAEV